MIELIVFALIACVLGFVGLVIVLSLVIGGAVFELLFELVMLPFTLLGWLLVPIGIILLIVGCIVFAPVAIALFAVVATLLAVVAVPVVIVGALAFGAVGLAALV